MANVRLLKDHNGQKKGTTGPISDSRADYLVREGIAELVESETPAKVIKSKKVEPCKSC